MATSTQYEWLATGRGKMALKPDSAGGPEGDALQLNYYAHDQVEERMLLALRQLEYWQSVAVTELAESLAAGRLND